MCDLPNRSNGAGNVKSSYRDGEQGMGSEVALVG